MDNEYGMTKTGFFWDEHCFWHAPGGYALTAPLGGLIQPLAAGGSPEDPETKRRFKNLLDVTGLVTELHVSGADPASRDDLLRVHPASYLDAFKAKSDELGGELTLGARASFSHGGYEIAAQSAGLAIAALRSVLTGETHNAYALCRPPGHHCLPDRPNGFCLFNNIAIAIEAARHAGLAKRFAVVDWDVHHGNGTEAIYYSDPDVLTISIHQDRNYPWDTGGIEDQGNGAGQGANMNIPLPPGGGHETYLASMEKLVVPALHRFKPDVIIVACGFDASGVDPLSRMVASAETFSLMTQHLMTAADTLCDGRLMMTHEGGYSELHVPFCGHAVLQQMSGSTIHAEDPLDPRMRAQQPDARTRAYFASIIDSYVTHYFD